MKCNVCKDTAVVSLPSHNAGFCAEHFFQFFSRQVARAIKDRDMFGPDDRILVAVSGGKDSLGLTLELQRQGYDVTALFVDLGIPGSSDAARRRIEAFCQARDIRLTVKECAAEGLAIPEVKAATTRPICAACGRIKRHIFNRTAREEGFDVLATGHNLDDEVARLFANTLRWDLSYLAGQAPDLPGEGGFAKKVKPLFRLTEFETANYAFLQGIDYHVDPCPYSTGASFTQHKALLADLEHHSPGQKLAFYKLFLRQGRAAFQALEQQEGGAVLAPCERCASPTATGVCVVCRLREQVARAGALPFAKGGR